MVAAAALVVACAPQVGGTFEQGVERLPGPGYIHLVTQPATSEIALTFTLIVPDGTDSQVHTTVQPGEAAAVDLTALPGAHAIRMNGVACDGRFPVEGDRVTEVVVRITLDGCSTAVAGIRDAEEMRQP